MTRKNILARQKGHHQINPIMPQCDPRGSQTERVYTLVLYI